MGGLEGNGAGKARNSGGVAPEKLLPEKMISEARQQLFEIREGILRLMDEFRGRS